MCIYCRSSPKNCDVICISLQGKPPTSKPRVSLHNTIKELGATCRLANEPISSPRTTFFGKLPSQATSIVLPTRTVT